MAPKGSRLARQTLKNVRKDPEAAHQLADWHLDGEEGLVRNLSLWLRWETEAAERGCIDAQGALGDAYLLGDNGVEVDLVVSTKWFRRAALQGDAVSTFNMGLAFQDGTGVEVNFSTAADWYRKAMSLGSLKAMQNLGGLLDEGRPGLMQDCKAAVELYRKAIERGSVDAMENLGHLLMEGRPGVPQDCKAAAELYSKAIERGSVDALWGMGLLYDEESKDDHGILEDNLTTALSYWQRAAYMGHAGAAREIGRAYWLGRGGYKESLKLAKKYTRIATAQGDEEAIERLEEMTTCANCGTGDAPKVCGGCKNVHYCNKKCLLLHWRDHSDPHKPECTASAHSLAAAKKKRSTRVCTACGAHGAKMLCSDCLYEGDPKRKVRYCDAACQRVHWHHPADPHKALCGGCAYDKEEFESRVEARTERNTRMADLERALKQEHPPLA
mmetsp:Transcript_40672/g.100505  ORF Transcript_40672/g.100505 Transcript_40672/m.100505 type:complete len:442 (-) Transcript_40672:233-1558(-)